MIKASDKTKRYFYIKIIVIVLAVLGAAGGFPKAFALEDGVYTVGRTTSYANPETGVTEDGGTNIALGDSMCESIVEEQALVEIENGKTYVTLGLGLMSNISDVKIKIQGDDGSYRFADITQTGTCERNGDTCNHYRFQVDSPENLISPVIFVTPMGREVQFFVKPDMTTAKPGTGNFTSFIGESTSKETTSSLTEETTENIFETTADVTKESFETSKTAEKTNDAEKSDRVNIFYVLIPAVLVVGAAVFVLLRKKRR